MKISYLDKNTNYNNGKNVAFGNNDPNLRQRLDEAGKKLKEAVKNKSDFATFEKIEKELDEIKKSAEKKVEIKVPGIFVKCMKWFGMPKKTGNKALDSAKTVTRLVLWGNTAKEAVNTGLYTVQALTNQDLPKDKRKFVGIYDLAVGVISTSFSVIFGVGLEDKVKKGYEKMLEPLTKSSNKPAVQGRAKAAIVGLAALSSFVLQTIIAKRIIAVAIGTPIAGKAKKYLEAQEAEKKKGKQSDPKKDNIPIENDILLSKVPNDSDKVKSKAKT